MKEARDIWKSLSSKDIFIASLGYADSGLYRHFPSLLADIKYLMGKLNPVLVYTHTIEGGHVDHDVTGLAVRVVRALNHYSSTSFYEWAEYSKKYSLRNKTLDFVDYTANESVCRVPTQDDISRKAAMLRNND